MAMELPDFKQLAAEVSVQHGIRLDPDDPIMAVVTLNRLVLEGSLNEALRVIQTTTAEFHQAAERVQIRAGATVGQEVRECVALVRGELQKDIDQARLDARKLIGELSQVQSRWFGVRWLSAGVLAGAILFAIGFYVGMLLR
jgi:hypothetical protein